MLFRSVYIYDAQARHLRIVRVSELTPPAAKWIYRWTLPVVPPGEIMTYEHYGTLVQVIDQATWANGQEEWS